MLLLQMPHAAPSAAASRLFASLCQASPFSTTTTSNSSNSDGHNRDAPSSSSLLAGAAAAAQDAAAAEAAASADITNAQTTPAMDAKSYQQELKGQQRDSLLPDEEQHPADPYAAQQQQPPRPDDYHEEGDGAVGPSSSFPS
jgi:hypothetical protein